MKYEYNIKAKNEDLKESVYSTIEGDIKKAFKKINSNIDLGKESAVSSKYLSLSKADRNDTIVIAQVMNQRIKLISKLGGLLKEGQLTGVKLKNFKYVNRNMLEVEKRHADFYQRNDIIIFNKNIDYLGIKKGDYSQVIDRDVDSNKIMFSLDGSKELLNFSR